MNNERLVEIKNLSVEFPTKRGTVYAVNNITYHVDYGDILGIVGESGSGKSTSVYAMMGLLRNGGHVTSGSISLDGRDMLSISQKELRAIRAEEVGMIFQNPMECLDPMFTIGSQMIETLRAHRKIPKSVAKAQAIEMLGKVGIHNAADIMKRYQHELSGGMRQRVLIAMILLLQPKLLIADEPTTAVDVTIQDQIIGLLKDICENNDMSMIFITHNFGVVADICTKVCVMYGGSIMESGTVDELFYRPVHPYTKGLLNAIPKADLSKKEKLVPVEGSPIDPFAPPSGCVFHPRCTSCMDICIKEVPKMREVSQGHCIACWLCDGEESE